MAEPRKISQAELREVIAPLVPKGIDADEVIAGVALSLVAPSDRTLPIVRNPFNKKVYAWSEDDASATKLALELLSHLGQGLLAGPAGLLHLGLALKEVVCFLIDLNRNMVSVTDPLQIKLLLLLRDAEGGLAAQQLHARLHSTEGPTLAEIEMALDALSRADAKARPKQLVRADGMIWKILV